MSIISPFPLTHDKDVTPDGDTRKPRVRPLCCKFLAVVRTGAPSNRDGEANDPDRMIRM